MKIKYKFNLLDDCNSLNTIFEIDVITRNLSEYNFNLIYHDYDFFGEELFCIENIIKDYDAMVLEI